MGVFFGSDKYGKSQDWIDLSSLDLIDLSKEFPTSGGESLLFGRFQKAEISEMLLEARVLEALEERGYLEFSLEIEALSSMDNRIYIKDAAGEILVHMRLKVSEFKKEEFHDSFRLVYIDWLLTQHVRQGKPKDPSKLFKGQEYPGLSLMKELTHFIRVISEKIGAHGAFNVPEYFHDAVLFQKNFKFIDPIKEGEFRALLKIFRKVPLRKLSNLIHSNQIQRGNGEVFQWVYGEMLSCTDPYLEDLTFSSSYFHKVKSTLEDAQFSIRNQVSA